jgi:hypothetical protein
VAVLILVGGPVKFIAASVIVLETSKLIAAFVEESNKYNFYFSAKQKNV